jgi:hypothetical protein
LTDNILIQIIIITQGTDVYCTKAIIKVKGKDIPVTGREGP